MPTPESRPKPRPIAVLQTNTLLNALSAAEIEGLAALCRPVFAERGESIWLRGADIDFFGMAADGFVKMVRSYAGGGDVTIELMGPGHIFGLMGTVTGTGCPLSACAVSDLWYLRIPKRPFLEIYERSPALKDRLIRKTALRLHGAVDLMARMTSGRVDERIAAILFILSESYGKRENGSLRIEVPLTRQEIGEMAGTTVESTIRVMSRWQKEGLVATDRQHVVVLDERRLGEILAR
jgi:CRP/FNR family transcriptional regulator